MSNLKLSRRAVASLLLASTGCTSWKTQTAGAEAVVAASPQLQRTDTMTSVGPDGMRSTTVSPGTIRVATTSGWMELTQPRVANDTLFGMASEGASETGIPLGQITAVQVRKGSAGKTVGLVVGLTLVGLVLAGGIAASTCEPSGIGSIC